MKKILTSLTIIIGLTLVHGQDFRFGKVSEEELAEKIHAVDSSANAAILYRNENIRFLYTEHDGFMQEREVHERVKIYNKEGYDWATKKVFIYKGSSGNVEKLINVKGATFNLIDGKVEKDRLRNNGIFEEEYNEYTEINTLTMPNIQNGCVIEYSYKIISPFLEIDDVYFQSTIPINKLDVSIATPQFYHYSKELNLMAFYFPNIKEGKKNKAYTSTSSSRSGFYISKTNVSQNKNEYFDNTLTILEENIPAVKEESYAGNLDNYISKMSLELSAFLNEYGGLEKSFSSSWEKVSNTIFKYASFGGQLKRDNFYKDDLKELINGLEDPFQKSAILHSYVKSKVRWNGNYGYTSRQGIKKAYKEGVGNIGDINLLLVSMLKSQGMNAYPVLVSTKDNGIPLFPTRKGFNYVICMVEESGSYMLLDASEPYSAPNVLPLRALNWQGRVVRDDGSSEWVQLRPNSMSNESTFLNIQINSDFSAKGKIRKSLSSQAALSYRNRFASMSTDDHLKVIEKSFGDVLLSDLEMENAKNIIEPVKLSYNYSINEAVDEIGDNLYFSPLLFMVENESPFKLEKRNYPIDFQTPLQQKYFVNIQIPDGYKVDTLPKSEILEFKDGEVSYRYIAKSNGKFLQFNITFHLKKSIIAPQDYAVFKTFYEKIIEKQAEQIVLTKA